MATFYALQTTTIACVFSAILFFTGLMVLNRLRFLTWINGFNYYRLQLRLRQNSSWTVRKHASERISDKLLCLKTNRTTCGRHLHEGLNCVSATQTNLLIYSEAADSNLCIYSIMECFQIFKILTYKLVHFSKYIRLHHLSEFVLTVNKVEPLM